MKKKILAIISVFLVFTLVFSFAGCTTEEEPETTYKINTPLPEDPTEGTNEDGQAVTDPTYSEAELEDNTTVIFDYFLRIVGELRDDKAAVTVGVGKGVGKAKNDKDEEIPMSENDYINVAIETLAPYMFADEGEEFEYGTDIATTIPLDTFAALTREDVINATSSNQGQFRVITININGTADTHDVDGSIVENFENEEVKKYMSLTKAPSYQVKEGTIIVTVLVETDEITKIEYIKNADVSTAVKGEGTLESVEETDVTFRYTTYTTYDINREKPQEN